jgi:hypothetical protein
MKRLTEIDEYGNADIIGMEDETWQMGLSFNDMNKVTLALNRLHRLEKLYEHHKQPDPITGLMPCGCGGKAEIGQYCEVTCDKCGASVPANYTEADAKEAWNRAMGCKGGAE